MKVEPRPVLLWGGVCHCGVYLTRPILGKDLYDSEAKRPKYGYRIIKELAGPTVILFHEKKKSPSVYVIAVFTPLRSILCTSRAAGERD